MSSPLLRRLSFGLFFVLAFAFLPTPGRAELVWSRDTGWKVQGGVLAGLTGKEAATALNLMNQARLHEEAGSLRRAAKAYEKVGKKYPTSLYASEAYYRAAKIRFAQKKWTKSFENYQSVITRYPNSGRFDSIIGEEYEIATALLNGARGRILWIIPGFTQRDRGIEFLETLVFNAPSSVYAPLSLMNIAHAHQRNGSQIEAIDALDRLINGYPTHVLTPDAYLKIAQLYASLVDGPYYDQAAAREAITYFEDFMILFPADANVAAAETGLIEIKKELALSKIKIAEFYFYKRDNFKAARVFYNEAITVFPDSEVASIARTQLEKVAAAEAKAQARAEAEKAKGKKKKRFFLF